MAEEKASKININGQEYEIKDAQARESIAELQEKVITGKPPIAVKKNITTTITPTSKWTSPAELHHTLAKKSRVKIIFCISNSNITALTIGIHGGILPQLADGKLFLMVDCGIFDAGFDLGTLYGWNTGQSIFGNADGRQNCITYIMDELE